MWTITAGIDEINRMPEVMAAVATVEANRDRAIIPEDRIVPEALGRASDEARSFWYEKGYAIPAPGTCSLRKIETAALD
jgi:hypothetical protein